MTVKQANKAVSEVHDQLIKALKLENWDVKVFFKSLEEDQPGWVCRGVCHAKPEYQKASITLDPACNDDSKIIQDTLRHELIHVVLSYIKLYRDQMITLIGDDEKVQNVEHLAYNQMIEMQVRHLEHIFDGLGVK